MDETELSLLRSDVIRYYTERVRRYGSTPPGVDWTCTASQYLRFVQLVRLCDFAHPFSLNDVGCGYGALVGFLTKHHSRAEIDYLGIDLARTMVRRAKRLWRAHPGTAFVTGNSGVRLADYSVASGIFNVKLDQPTRRWENYIALTLESMRATSRRGFAVNFMTSRQPPPIGGREALYRTSPQKWIRHCEREFGASVTLLEDYGQPEFTLLVRPAP